MPSVPRDARRTLLRDPAARVVVRSWRALTGGMSERERRGSHSVGERVLIGCSGGADSSALAIALASTGSPHVVAHIIHDMRVRQEALADRDAARCLADQVGLMFREAEVRVSGSGAGNAESAARRERYRALADLALAEGCRFVATAHHADDQFETVIMAMLRGSGPRGLAGIAASRRVRAANGVAVTVIRPMLGIERPDTERICSLVGWEWQEDPTNAPVSGRLRATVRHEVLPSLRALRPGVALRVSTSARLMSDVADSIDADAESLIQAATRDGPATVWPRGTVKVANRAIVGAALRAVCRRSSGQMDRITAKHLAPVLRAIADSSTEPRTFFLRSHILRVTAGAVSVERRGADSPAAGSDPGYPRVTRG